MYVPCATCSDRGRCVDEDVTYREAVFAWLAGGSLGCNDYREDSYHGVDGCVDVSSAMSTGDIRGVSRRSGGYGWGIPLHVGAK